MGRSVGALFITFSLQRVFWLRLLARAHPFAHKGSLTGILISKPLLAATKSFRETLWDWRICTWESLGFMNNEAPIHTSVPYEIKSQAHHRDSWWIYTSIEFSAGEHDLQYVKKLNSRGQSIRVSLSKSLRVTGCSASSTLTQIPDIVFLVRLQHHWWMRGAERHVQWY